MSSLRHRLPYGWIGAGIAVLALSSFFFSSYAHGTLPWLDRRPMRERYRVREVSRTDLAPVLNAPGRLESAKRTFVRCQLENIAGATSGAASTMLTVVPEGTVVKKGDVLATLDASNYEEMQRQQVITVEQAKASHLQAQLNLEIALLGVSEYRNGIVEETLKGMEGSLALARSNLSVAADHLDWTSKMSGKGYASLAQIVSEKYSVAQMQFTVDKQLMSMDLYQRFTQPKTEKSLQQQVTVARTALKNEDLRLERQVDRLATLTKQVEYCIIRAPHDGVVYYFKDPDPRRRDPVLIEEGMEVHQRQTLFYLPDLSEMEVQMALNESVVNRVRAGMRTKVRFEALPDLELDGEVTSISQFPASQGQRGEDVRYFMSVVKLDKTAPGLTPGMTTRIDVLLRGRRNVLAIPLESIKSFKSEKVCYVAHEDSLERRPVELGQETSAMVEITEGLQEGELVVINPPSDSSLVESFRRSDEQDSERSAGSQTVASSQH
jgi:HlyD family secretion protein